MSEFFIQYGLFLIKTVTVLIAVVIGVAVIASSKAKQKDDNEITIKKLNDKFDHMKQKLQSVLLDKKELKKIEKEKQKAIKAEAKSEPVVRLPRLYVLDFDGDIKASGVTSLREEITALLTVAETQDEVLIRLDNSGGIVHEHGLAASQLQRIKDAKIKMTISVDKVAASGGYMMACVADQIIAAPFAVIGSIGVLAQLPNFNRLLDRAGIDFEQHTAGEYKRTVTLFGKNTDQDREKLQQDLEETHQLFRDYVSTNRPKLDIDAVATGEHWYGTQAIELNLVDQIITSDDFIAKAVLSSDVYSLTMERKLPLLEKLFSGVVSATNKAKDSLIDENNRSNYR